MAVGSAQDKTGKLEVRPEEHAALVDGRPLSLTVRELQLLVTLWSNPQRILTREELHTAVWGTEPRRDDRSVDVFIRKLRQKLEKRSPEWEYIHTHFGVGYRFDPEPSGDAVPAAPLAPTTPAVRDQSSQVVHKSFTAA